MLGAEPLRATFAANRDKTTHLYCLNRRGIGHRLGPRGRRLLGNQPGAHRLQAPFFILRVHHRPRDLSGEAPVFFFSMAKTQQSPPLSKLTKLEAPRLQERYSPRRFADGEAPKDRPQRSLSPARIRQSARASLSRIEVQPSGSRRGGLAQDRWSWLGLSDPPSPAMSESNKKLARLRKTAALAQS